MSNENDFPANGSGHRNGYAKSSGTTSNSDPHFDDFPFDSDPTPDTPQVALERLEHLRKLEIEYWKITRLAAEEENELVREIEKARSAIGVAGKISDGSADPENENIEKQIVSKKERLERLEIRRKLYEGREVKLGALINSAEKLLETAKGSLSAATTEVDPEITTIEKALELRAFSIEQRSKILNYYQFPPPPSIAKENIINQVNKLADRCAPGATNTLEFGSPISWPETEQKDAGASIEDHHTPRDPAVRLLCWLFRDQVIERLTGHIEEPDIPDEPADAEDHENKAPNFEANILYFGRIAAELAWKAGTVHELPENIDPRALLGVDGPYPYGPSIGSA